MLSRMAAFVVFRVRIELKLDSLFPSLPSVKQFCNDAGALAPNVFGGSICQRVEPPLVAAATYDVPRDNANRGRTKAGKFAQGSQ
jgi:hypothetical protein